MSARPAAPREGVTTTQPHGVRAVRRRAWWCAAVVVPVTTVWMLVAPIAPAIGVVLAVVGTAIAAVGVGFGILSLWRSHGLPPRAWLAASSAVCVLALVNPAVGAGLSAFVVARAGVITIEAGRGAVFWSTYPGVAGWQAPTSPPAGDAAAIARASTAATGSIADGMSARFGTSWHVGERATGALGVPNGFGGESVFAIVQAPVWQSDGFDGSTAQRATLLDLAQSAADQLGLGRPVAVADDGVWAQARQPTSPVGDIATGDGSRIWAAGHQTLVLVVAGGSVTITYTAGPFVSRYLYQGEYQHLFAGFPARQPAPIAPIDPS